MRIMKLKVAIEGFVICSCVGSCKLGELRIEISEWLGDHVQWGMKRTLVANPGGWDGNGTYIIQISFINLI